MNLKAQIPKLLAGETIQIRPHGNSMAGKIDSGQLVTIEPIKDNDLLAVGDIVLSKVNGKVYLHLISAIQSNRLQISNNKGKVNGWTLPKNVYGKVTKVEN
jgi:hypothetical protein